jgi:hypothetical protein
MKNNLKRYALASHVTNNELSRRVFVKTKRGGGEISIFEVRKKVVWYEHLFDVIMRHMYSWVILEMLEPIKII